MSRIVLVLNGPDEPSETFQRALAVDLAEVGHEVVIYGLRGDPPADGTLHPRISYERPMPRLSASGTVAARIVRHPDAALRARRAARERWGPGKRSNAAAVGVARLAALEPDAIHLGFSGIGASLADLFDVWDEVPVVVSCRGTDELVRPLFDDDRRERLGRILRRAQVVHCVADAVADAAVRLGARPESIRVIRPAVDLDRWASGPRPAPGPPWRVSTTTRLVPAKGVEDLVTATAILAERGVDLAVDVVGGGPNLDDLRLRAERCGVADRVSFAGTVEADALVARVRAAHLYVSPSLSEGTSNGVLEAMAAGVPAISTDVGGMPEVIEHDVEGWLVPPGRPDVLAAAIESALDHPDVLAAIGAAGRARVVRRHDRSDQAAGWRALYASLLGIAPGSDDDDHAPRGGRPVP